MQASTVDHSVGHDVFRVLRKLLPSAVVSGLRRLSVALYTPIAFSSKSGHFKSSLRMRAVDGAGRAIPWYTYPCIDFLRRRSFRGQRILEFGGGQSTLWWAERANTVLTMEGDHSWAEELRTVAPSNAEVESIAMSNAETCVGEVEDTLRAVREAFHVIVIDGLYRAELVPIALERLAPTGVIICDNSEGYGITEAFENSGLHRVDFWGHAPGVPLTHCTSIFFGPDAEIFVSPGPIDGPQ